MKISPDPANAGARERIRFETDSPEESATWTRKGIGTIDKTTGLYTAPWLIWAAQSAVVTATAQSAATGGAAETATATATVKLTSERTWLIVLSVYLTVILTVIVGLLWWKWPSTSTSEGDLVIGPASVVLREGEAVQFQSSERSVKWSDNTQNGLFTAPAKSAAPPATASAPLAAPASPPETVDAGPAVSNDAPFQPPVTIEAVRSDGSGVRAAGTAWVGPHYLTVSPPLAVLHPGEVVQLAAQTDAKWPKWIGNGCTANGVCTAPAKIDEVSVVLATVTTSEPSLSASVPIRLVPFPIDPGLMIWIAALFGMLGGWVHAAVSLGGYVGNDKFMARWNVFYLTCPFVGGGLSLIVFLAARGQILKDGLNGSDVQAIAGLSALVGLFSDITLRKLKEVIEVAFGPRNDDRTDKMSDAPADPPEPAPAPVIDAVEPAQLPRAGQSQVVIKGKAFGNGSKARVGGALRDTTLINSSEIHATLNPSDMTAGKALALTVANPGGAISNEKTVTVAP